MPLRRLLPWVLGALLAGALLFLLKEKDSPREVAAAAWRHTANKDANALFSLLERRVMRPDFPQPQRRAILGTLLPRLWEPELNAGLQAYCDRLERAQKGRGDGPANFFYRQCLLAAPLGAYRPKTGYAAASPALRRAVDWFSVNLGVAPPSGVVSLPPAYGEPGDLHDASNCRGVHVTVTAPEGRPWTLAVSEDGWDRPRDGYRGARGADGERWYLEPRRGTGRPHTERFLFSELRPDPLRGNQRGGNTLDSQAIVRVDVMAVDGIADFTVGPLHFTP